MSHAQSPPGGGAGIRRGRAALLKRAGLGVLAPAIAACAIGVAPAAAQAATTGSISGSFTVPAGTHDAAADVNISVVDRTGAQVNVNPSHITITDVSGSTTTADYTITGLNPGQYYIYFSDTTTGDNVAPDYYGDGGVDNITKGTVVTVPSTGGTQSLTAVTLSGGATITGTVTDANSASETQAQVTALPNSATVATDPMLSGLTATVTSGTYKISGLPAGKFSLRYDATGSSFSLTKVYVDGTGLTYDSGSANWFGPLAAGSTTTANFAVPGVGAISGTVNDSSSHPLAGVHVSVYDAIGNVIPSGATTAVDGT